MKKIVKLSLIFLIAICIVGNVYAILNCNIDIKTNKSQYSKNEEFTVNINLSNVKADKGIIAFGGTLEYDKDSLTLVKMEGKSNWSNPSYNEQNGKFVLDRGSVTKSDETTFQITFKVKDTKKSTSVISLKNVTISDGTETKKIELVDKSITIKGGTSNPDSTPGDDNQGSTNQPPNGNTNQNVNSGTNGDTTYDKGKLPKTGENNISVISIVFLIIFFIILLDTIIRIKVINKKQIRKRRNKR